MTIGMFIALLLVIMSYVAAKNNRDEFSFFCICGAILFIGM